MELLNTVIQILKKPFPENESFASFLRLVAGISVFIASFLYIFSPHDMSNLESGKFLICLGFGLVAFVSMTLYELSITRLFRLKAKGENFTYAKWILNMIGMMFTISLANFLYIRLVYFGYINWEFFPNMIHGTFTIGILPIIIVGAYTLMRQERKYQNIAAEMNEKVKDKLPTLNTNDLSVFDIPVNQIRYVEALQNYVKIGYLNDKNQLQEQTERATLKNISDQVQDSSILKCHRSYLVNQNAIVSSSGNAQGLLLSLSDCDKEIPVSRSYVATFRDK